MPLDSRETPNVPELFGPIQPQASLFLHRDKAPNLIALNVLANDVPHGLFHEGSALLAGFDHVVDDRIAMDAEHALQGSDRIAFQEQAENRQHLLRIDAPMIHGPRLFIRERPLADIAPRAYA